MQVIMNATYKNGTLILDKNLGIDMEGKRFKILLLEQERSRVLKSRFLKFIEKHAFSLSKDYKFDREELHER